MAEPIGMASGLIALAAFAFKSSVALCSTVKSFQFHPQRVRDLVEQLETLSTVLRVLTETVSTTTDVDLSALELPLQRCGDACREFEGEILACLKHSHGSRTSFRDWAKLKYMGDDIDGFRHMLAGYQSTINIALTDANLRKSSVTAEHLEEYRNLIKTATDDLEAHLESIDGKLETIFTRTLTGSDADAVEMRLIREERASTHKCLQICSQLSDHIDQIQLHPAQHSKSSSGPTHPVPLSEIVTSQGLQECQDSLRNASAKLERHMHDVVDRLLVKSKTSMASEEEIAELTRLQEEWKTARHCMSICSRADDHLKETISVIENFATGDDTIQFLVSTNDRVIHGKNRGYGMRQRQVGGHLSDLSLQQISRDMANVSLAGKEDQSERARSAASPASGVPVESTLGSGFRERYGKGVKLASEPTSDGISVEKPDRGSLSLPER